MITKQFTLYLENRPGALAEILKKVSSSRINIEGISVAATSDVGLVQLVTNDAVKTRSVLKKVGVAYTEQDVCVVAMPDEPGALSMMVSALAAAKLNLNYVYATGSGGAGNKSSKVVISAANLKKIEAAWKSMSRK